MTTQGETLKKEEMILESTLTHLEKEQQTLQQTVAQLESQLNAVLTEQGVTEDQLTEWLKEVPTLESQQEQIALFEQEQTQLTIQLAEIEKKLSSDTFPELSLITTEIEQITQQIEEQEKNTINCMKKCKITNSWFKKLMRKEQQLKTSLRKLLHYSSWQIR